MFKIKNKKKIGLVLSGGGPKAAAFHLGVCLALQEKGFKFIGGTKDKVEDSPDANNPLAIKLYVGSSAGALVSALLASGHSIEDVLESFEMGTGLIRKPSRKTKIKPFGYLDMFTLPPVKLGMLFRALIKDRKSMQSGGVEASLKHYFKVSGLFTASGVESYMRQYVLPTNSYSELGVDLFSIATFLNKSKKAVFGARSGVNREGDVKYINYATISDGVTASASLPPLFSPWRIKNPKGEEIDFYDGEIRETLSTHVATDNGADLVIASYSIQPYNFTPEIGSLSDYGIPLIVNQALYQVIEQKINKSIHAREDIRSILSTISGYFREHNLPLEHVERLEEIISKKMAFNKNVDYIYIHPSPQNYEMFFADHFSLNKTILARVVKIGFKTAIAALRKYDV